MVRTRNKLIQPTSKDGITTLETIISNEQISISGLLALSHLASGHYNEARNIQFTRIIFS